MSWGNIERSDYSRMSWMIMRHQSTILEGRRQSIPPSGWFGNGSGKNQAGTDPFPESPPRAYGCQLFPGHAHEQLDPDTFLHGISTGHGNTFRCDNFRATPAKIATFLILITAPSIARPLSVSFSLPMICNEPCGRLPSKAPVKRRMAGDG